MSSPPVVNWPRQGRAQLFGAFAQDELDVDTPWHHHEVHQIQYAVEGALEVEDAARRSFLPRHLAAWIPAGVAHRTSLHRVHSVSVLLAPHLVTNPGESVRIVPVSPLMREMIRFATRWPLGETLDATGEAFFTTFGALCSEWIEEETALFLPISADVHLRAAMDFTSAHLAGGVTIRDVSEAAGLTERTLRRRFHDLGMSWEEYRRRRRLLAAVELLDSTTLPIGEIAACVGYTNQSAFAKAFQDALRVSPSDFRNRAP